MTLALSKFTIAKDADEWMPKIEDDPKIVALSTTIQAQKEVTDKLTKIITEAAKIKQGSNGSSTGKGKKNKQYSPESWKRVPPKDGEEHTKVGPNGKTYHWCLNHLMWCLHTTEQCHKKPPSVNVTSEGSSPPPADNLTKAYSACLTLDDDLASINAEDQE